MDQAGNNMDPLRQECVVKIGLSTVKIELMEASACHIIIYLKYALERRITEREGG